MAKYYMLSDITPKLGHLNQSYIWDLTWVDPDTLEVYMMIVDSSYRNYSRWANIIDNRLLGLYTGMRRSSRQGQGGHQVMSADSHPQLITPMSEGEIMDLITLVQEGA